MGVHMSIVLRPSVTITVRNGLYVLECFDTSSRPVMFDFDERRYFRNFADCHKAAFAFLSNPASPVEVAS